MCLRFRTVTNAQGKPSPAVGDYTQKKSGHRYGETPVKKYSPTMIWDRHMRLIISGSEIPVGAAGADPVVGELQGAAAPTHQMPVYTPCPQPITC